MLYGTAHRYGTPQIGHGRDDQGVHGRRSARVLRGRRSGRTTPTLLVVGDVTADKVDAAARDELRRVEGAGPARRREKLPPVEQPAARQVYLVDKPGAPQSQIRIGWIGVPRSTPDYFPLR